ncbi:MAG: hypothetical protein IAG13_11465, partial [Deltaproteobacteria bacterium]|nr:hypothetical protein [Nannocystaceae bacterium]
AGVPTVHATAEDARGWLGSWLDSYERRIVPIAHAVRAVQPADAGADSLAALLGHALVKLERASAVRLGRFAGDPDELWGRELAASTPTVLTGASLAVDPVGTVWLDERHVLVRAALVHHPVQPLVAMSSLLFAITASWPSPRPEIADVIEVIDELRRSAEASA